MSLINCAILCWSLSPKYCEGEGLGRHQPPPLRILDSNQWESIVLSCADIFLNCTGSFFQFPGGGVFSKLSPLIANFRFETMGINCAQLCCNFFQLYRPLFSITRGWFSELSPPLRISDSKQRESIVPQLCSIVPTPFFSITRGVVFGTQTPIANFGFGSTGINCAPIMLNCAAIPFTCAGPFFHEAITRGRILRNCTSVSYTHLTLPTIYSV